MRVLRLDLPGGPVELHPYVSVVRGLAPVAREALLQALAAIPRGKAMTTGLVEAQGVLLDLDEPTLDLLDLHGDADPVVRATDLPGGPTGARAADAARALAEAEAAAAAAEAEVERAGRALDGAREALDAARSGTPASLDAPRDDAERAATARTEAERALDAAVAAERAAARAVHDADARADAARAARAEATRAVSVAAAALDAAADRRDPMAPAALEAARAALAAAERAVAEARAADDGGAATGHRDPSELGADEVAALRAARVEAEAAVLALETADPTPIRLALDQLESFGAAELVPDPRALALADEWHELETDLAHLDAADTVADDHTGAADRVAARERLLAAEAEVAAAESALRPPAPDPADVAALEAAHAAVTEAREALERRFGRSSAEKRLAQAEATEKALLERLGYATFTDFVLGHHGPADLAALHRVEAARAELAAATAAAREVDAAIVVELRRAELFDRRRALRAVAAELLGDDPGDDVGGALRRRRVPAVETGGHLARLRAALEATGLVLGDEDLPQRTLADLARVWLEEHERSAAERARLEQRVAELDALLAAAGAGRRARAAAGAAAPSPLAAALAGVDEARAAVTAAEARYARHREAEAELERRRQAFEQAAATEVAAAAALAEAEAGAADARAAERAAAEAVRAASAALDQRRRAEEAAVALLGELEGRVAGGGVAALEDELARATAALNEARAEAAQRAAAVELARAGLAAAEAAAHDPDPDPDPIADVEDAEWFLLARLAAQRAVSFAGSVPFVLDDALAGFDIESTRRLLDRLERMAATVQVVIVTEDLTSAAWAESLGPARAAVVEP